MLLIVLSLLFLSPSLTATKARVPLRSQRDEDALFYEDARLTWSTRHRCRVVKKRGERLALELASKKKGERE